MATEKRRRQYGSGSVYQRAADGVWVGTIEAGYTKTGARRRITVSGPTEAVVKSKLKKRMRELDRDGAPTASARTTVKAWSEEWLAMTERTLRPKPWATDRSAVRQWIIPTIGHKQLATLTPADIRAVATAQRDATPPRSSSTAHRTHTTLTSMLRAAMIDGHDVPARVLLVKPPELAVSDRAAMTIPEALAMLYVASDLPHGSRWAMAFLHGMRQGECLGLTWPAINFDAQMLIVEWQLQSLPWRDRKNKALGFRLPDGYEVRHLADAYHLVRPKSRKGYRVIPLVPAMRDALVDWREITPPSPHGLVWPAIDGRPANVKHDLTEWQAIQCTAEVGHPAGRYYVPHEARHATATQLMAEGVDESTITAIMGHSSIVTSRGYIHSSQALALEALSKVAKRLQLG